MPKIAAIHDLSGLGRTSLNAVIPILSTLGMQVCPMPTAVLSSGTSGFSNFHFHDLTESMRAFLEHWKSIPLEVDAVYSGFLGSPGQVDIVAACAEHCLCAGGLFIVDPVLGDHGQLEPTMGPDMVERMRWLASQATCVTPNLTEAALLLEEPYPAKMVEEGLPEPVLCDWLQRLSALGPRVVVITSVPMAREGLRSAVAAYDRAQGRYWKVDCDFIPAAYPGTGDIFTSVLTGCLMRGDSVPEAIDRAVQFVTLAIRATFGHRAPERDGVRIERVLTSLLVPSVSLSYVLMREDMAGSNEAG